MLLGAGNLDFGLLATARAGSLRKAGWLRNVLEWGWGRFGCISRWFGVGLRGGGSLGQTEHPVFRSSGPAGRGGK